jgi:predicted phosphate transport protein (TIGR00153 family)
MRTLLFGMLTDRSPLDGLTEHYDKIHECAELIQEALECYVGGTGCRDFQEVTARVDELEDQADKIKRQIRNHLPRRLFMPVDKTLFLNYTNAQDNILDSAQEAMHWLAMRRMDIPAQFQKPLVELIADVCFTTDLLGPALSSTLGLIYHQHLDRPGAKERFCSVRHQRHKVFRDKNTLAAAIYNADMEFKDIYQLIHFIERLADMSHNSEKCADILRAMIAR